MPHMPATGVSGVDLYARENSGWNWIGGKYRFKDTLTYTFQTIKADPDREYYLYLPLYNKVKWLEIGVPGDAHLEPLPASNAGSIVLYATRSAEHTSQLPSLLRNP